ncbi:hypothetical protein HYX19_00480 [Candidatus Woesearchaeota archaeon]|nr:hypothetical protein [Candidatus Woesearchaeota archaeon]
MVEFLIKTGVDSITVSPENMIKVKNLAEKTEKKKKVTKKQTSEETDSLV